MVELAAGGNPRLRVDARELRRTGPSYTVDTLLELRAELDAARPLCLLLGVDAYTALMTWSRWERLFDLAHLVVATRPGYALDIMALPAPLAGQTRQRLGSALDAGPAGRVLVREISALDISASKIRALLADGRSPRYLLPDSVLDYIESHHLYRDPHGS